MIENTDRLVCGQPDSFRDCLRMRIKAALVSSRNLKAAQERWGRLGRFLGKLTINTLPNL